MSSLALIARAAAARVPRQRALRLAAAPAPGRPDRLRAAGACIRDHGRAVSCASPRARPRSRRRSTPGSSLPSFKVDVALYFDAMTAVMCLVVTGIGTLIHVYSVGYMAHDKGFARYFAYLNLFLFFMLLLVLGEQPAHDVRRLGRRRALLVSADRLLVRGSREDARRHQGVHRQPRRRRRLPARRCSSSTSTLGIVRLPGDQRLVLERRPAPAA